MKLLEEEDGARLLVGGEEVLDGSPKLPGGLIIAGQGEVEDGVVDGAEEPTLDAGVGDDPLGCRERRCADEDRTCRTAP